MNRIVGGRAPLLYNDPEHWRQHSEETRALARKITDAVEKEAMRKIADRYERLAARAVERLAGQSPAQSNQTWTAQTPRERIVYGALNCRFSVRFEGTN
jgi:hypothetical protein